MNLQRYKHIIWDWNGTLLDDAWLAVECVNELLHRRNLPTLTMQRYYEMFDFPVTAFYQQLGFDLQAECFDQMAHDYHALYNPRWNECSLQPGVIEALEGFAALDLTQSVLSAAVQPMLRAGIDHYKLDNHFTRVLGLYNNKAHGKVVLGRAWMEQLHYDPHEVLLIGDTTHDAEVADAIDADCLLIAAGHHRRDKLVTTGRPVLDDLNQLDLSSSRNVQST